MGMFTVVFKAVAFSHLSKRCAARGTYSTQVGRSLNSEKEEEEEERGKRGKKGGGGREEGEILAF